MRWSLMLLLSAGSLAFGQTGPAKPFTFGQAPPAPFAGMAQGHDFGNAPLHWDTLSSLPQTIFDISPTTTSGLLGDATIDPKMVIHPSRHDLGALPAGTQTARNQFPRLTFQPIGGEGREPGAGALSTIWPKAKVKQIPTQWPKLKMDLVGGGLKGVAELKSDSLSGASSQ